MVGYVLVDEKNHKYIYSPKGKSDKFVVTDNPCQVKIFNGCVSANKALKNNVPTPIRAAFKAMKVSDIPEIMEAKGMSDVKSTIITSRSKVKHIAVDNASPQIQYLSSVIKDLYEYLGNMQTERASALSELSKLDRSLADVYHYMENNNLNASDGYKIYKKAQTLLQQRRNCKDKIRVIDTLNHSGINSERFGSIIDVLDIVTSPVREYEPRELTELFDEGVDYEDSNS